MNQKKYNIVQDIEINRRNFIEIIIIAVLIAIGVNLITDSLLALKMSSTLAISIGVLLCLVSILYIAIRFFGKRIKYCSFRAFLIYHNKKNEIIAVPRYRFSEKIHWFLQASFIENAALKKIWEKYPLKNLLYFKNEADFHDCWRCVQLVSEVTEYFMLNMLSTHLSNYFNFEKLKKKNLKKYRREDVPQVLLSNRFLELFSRAMEDRPSFVNNALNENNAEKKGETVGLYNHKKGLYERFDLILPKKSKIQRPDRNKIEIDTKKLKISMTIRFVEDKMGNPNWYFTENYLGIDFILLTEFYLDINLKIFMKLGGLFTKIGWEYYRWIDSFLENIEKEVSRNKFFERINWEAALTVLQCSNIKQSNAQKKK